MATYSEKLDEALRQVRLINETLDRRPKRLEFILAFLAVLAGIVGSGAMILFLT